MDIVTRLRLAVPDAQVCRDAAAVIVKQDGNLTQLRTLIADLLEWADHQACAIDDGQPCDCGYDALAAEWEQLRD